MTIIMDNSSATQDMTQPLTGVIKVHLTEPFEASAVTMCLKGYQRSHFTTAQPGDQFGKAPSSSGITKLARTVINETFVVAEFEPDTVQQGQSEYRFSMMLPDSVRESVMVQFGVENNLSETHFLAAQLEPRKVEDFANMADKVSKLRTDYALYLYAPHKKEEESKLGNPTGLKNESLSKSVTSKVGGIAGLGSSEAKTVIKLDKDTFAPGEKI